MVEEGSAGDVTSGLLGEYDGLKDARMARTPRTGPQGLFIRSLIQLRISH